MLNKFWGEQNHWENFELILQNLINFIKFWEYSKKFLEYIEKTNHKKILKTVSEKFQNQSW